MVDLKNCLRLKRGGVFHSPNQLFCILAALLRTVLDNRNPVADTVLEKMGIMYMVVVASL